MNPLTQRVKVGAYYTDGANLAEVRRVYPLGHIQLIDCSTEEIVGFGIDAFRRRWWLAAAPREYGTLPG